MTPHETIKQVSGETGITVRILLGLLGILVTVGVAVAGVGVGAITQMARMQSEINALGTQIATVRDTMRLEVNARFKTVEGELERRAPIVYGKMDRWTIEDMTVFVDDAEKRFRAIGVEVDLPEPYSIKRQQ